MSLLSSKRKFSNARFYVVNYNGEGVAARKSYATRLEAQRAAAKRERLTGDTWVCVSGHDLNRYLEED